MVVFFKGDDSKLSADLDAAEGKTKSFASTATNLIGGAVAGAAVAAGAAIVGIGVAAFDVSKDTADAAADIAASLGIPIAEAEKFAEVAKRVYGNNFADSVGDASEAVKELAKQLGLTADDPSLQTMTENAFRLRDVFGTDVAESINAVKTLTEEFGITNEEAFDLIAKGFQNGLDSSGDFLDTIGEYSVQFASGGATAGEFFSLLDSGLKGGVLGTDKAADAFKEFRVRIADGSKTTADALAQIGINVDDITAGMANGSLSAADAFTLVQQALNQTTDPVTRMQAGVGLLGTQFEDLGDASALALTLTNDWAAGSAGAIAGLDAKYATFGSAMDGLWRRLVVSVSPFTDKLLELINDVMPKVMAAFDAFDANIGPAMETIGNVVTTVFNAITPLFTSFGTTVDAASGPMKYWKDWVDTNLPLIKTLFENVLGAITVFWDMFGEDILYVVNNTFTVISTIIGTVMATIGDTITLALQLLTGDWEGAWETFKGIFERIWETIKVVVMTQLDSLRQIFSNINWGQVGETLMNAIWNGIKAVWAQFTTWFVAGLQNIWDLITGVDWASAGRSIVDKTRTGAQSVWGTFSSWVQTSSQSLLTYWNTTTWEQKGKDLVTAVKNGTEITWATLRSSLATGIDGLLGLFTGQDFTGTGERLISTIQTGVANYWPIFLTDVAAKINGIVTTFQNIDWAEAGRAMLDGIKRGFEERWEEFKSWFTGKLSQLTNLLPFSEPKDSNSPLRNLSRSGKSFVTNWWDGAESELGNLKGNLSTGLTDMMGAFDATRGSQPGMAGANGGMVINVTLSGDNATYEAGRAVGRGVDDELRRRGYK